MKYYFNLRYVKKNYVVIYRRKDEKSRNVIVSHLIALILFQILSLNGCKHYFTTTTVHYIVSLCNSCRGKFKIYLLCINVILYLH